MPAWAPDERVRKVAHWEGDPERAQRERVPAGEPEAEPGGAGLQHGELETWEAIEGGIEEERRECLLHGLREEQLVVPDARGNVLGPAKAREAMVETSLVRVDAGVDRDRHAEVLRRRPQRVVRGVAVRHAAQGAGQKKAAARAGADR